MRTIILTYPGFQSLPKGIKQMLLATESFNYAEINRAVEKSGADGALAFPLVTFPVAPDFIQPDQHLVAA